MEGDERYLSKDSLDSNGDSRGAVLNILSTHSDNCKNVDETIKRGDRSQFDNLKNEVEAQKPVGVLESVSYDDSLSFESKTVVDDVIKCDQIENDMNCHLPTTYESKTGLVCRAPARPETPSVDRNPGLIDKTPVRNINLSNLSNLSIRQNKTSSTKRSKKATDKHTQLGIKPFLCLKGKQLSCKLSILSPKKSVSVRDRVKTFEIKDTGQDANERNYAHNYAHKKSDKIRKMLEMYENEIPLNKKMVHASNGDIDGNTTGTRKDEFVKVSNAYELLMKTKGDTPERTPRKKIMKPQKSSTWTSGRKKEREKERKFL